MAASETQNFTRRILHIVENLDRGAVENWLVRMLKHARRHGVDVDCAFYCTESQPGAGDEEARALGARVIHSPVPLGEKLAFVRALRAELRRGNYDVLHSHHDFVSAVYLLAAHGLPIKKRLVHVHDADESVLTPSPLKQSVLRPALRHMCLAMADRIVGNSNHTLDTFLFGRPRREGKDIVHYYGVDPAPFEKAKGDRLAFRRELDLAEDSRILLFAGRIVPEKNPVFAVDVLAEMRRFNANVVGVFVGSGSLDEAVRRHAAELGLSTAFRHLGWRDDIPEIMCCCDWFILPHPEQPMEGFGLAIVEAQLAGLRLLLSQGISDDPLLSTAVFRRLPLSVGPKVWAEAAIDLSRGPTPSRTAALAKLKESPMDMDRALKGLLQLSA